MERQSGSQGKELIDSRAPENVAVIMDGNRREAKDHHISKLAGHQKGAENLKRILEACQERGVKTLTVWAFSTENWDRKATEVEYLMELMGKFIDQNIDELNQNDIRFRWFGNREDGRIPLKLKDNLKDAEEKTSGNTKFNFNVAFNYGGRDEMVRVVKKIVESGISPSEITWDNSFAPHLDTAEVGDPDLVIRTGEREGETKHLSGFMPLQIEKSRLYFTPTYWPDFTEEELDHAFSQWRYVSPRHGE